jgi:hypothetical protein
MRFIPTKLHGVADYVVGLIVIGLPFLFGVGGGPRAALVLLGTFVILYSVLTDYELGAVRFLRIRFHLLLDALFGAAMLIAPSLLDFPADARWPVYVIGALSLLLASTTQRRAQGTASTD